MPPGYSPGDVGASEWRRLASPVGALWLAGLAFAVVDRQSDDAAPPWPRVVIVVLAAALLWLAAGLGALGLAWLVEWVWLARWPRVGTSLVRLRRSRWIAHHRVAQEARQAGDVPRMSQHARRRNAIALAEPRCPFWTADRWASLEARVRGAYGLDPASAWPRLWLILPEPVRDELRRASDRWQRACDWGAWALMFVALAAGVGVSGRTVPALVAAAVGLALGVWAWRRGRAAIAYRAELVEATFDVHGSRLAEALGMKLGADGWLDPTVGEEITARLRKGS